MNLSPHGLIPGKEITQIDFMILSKRIRITLGGPTFDFEPYTFVGRDI